jgi:hypothetical protein
MLSTRFLSSLVQLIDGVVIFVVAYMLSAILIQILSIEDIDNLRQMLIVIGPLDRLFNAILKIIKNNEKTGNSQIGKHQSRR